MKPAHTTKHNRTLLAAMALCLAATTPLAYADEGSPNSVNDFLSDPQRVGSLTGTILGGALTAHPIGTLAGSIIGFFVGKETMHKSPNQQPTQLRYAQRSFVPTTPETMAAPPMLALNASTPKVDNNLQAVQPIASALDPAPTLTRPSPLEQIAALCYGNGAQGKANSPDLQALCYYHQSS